MKRTRRAVGIAFLCTLAPCLMLVWAWKSVPRADAVPAVGGAGLLLTNIAYAPYYLQTDPDWAEDAIGGSGERMSSVGCTVCCVSMAFSHLGIPMDPGMLNRELKSREGYTQRGWLKWSSAEDASGGRVRIQVEARPDRRTIDRALKNGHVAIVKVLLAHSVPHWVLIVGKDSGEYLVKDPLDQDRRIRRLSEISSTIHSVRIARHHPG